MRRVGDVQALMSTRRWIILPIESNVRELHARTLLAAAAAERGFGTIIVRAAELAWLLPALPPSVLLYMSAVFPDVFDQAREHRHVPTALDEEGLVRRGGDDYTRRRLPSGSLDRCARFFAWGEDHRRVVVSVAPQLSSRIVPVGNPRVDLLRAPLRSIYQHEVAALQANYGRFVLFNSNFGTFNHQLGAEARIQEWRARRWSESEHTEKLLWRTIDFQRAMFEEFVSLIQALTDALPEDVRVIVRPHPAERQDTWRDRLADLEHVRVIHEGPVIPWLLACEALIHNSCTTGIEADLLGRPSFAYLPIRDELAESALPNRVGSPFTDQVDIIRATIEVASAVRRNAVEAPTPLLFRHISNLDGRLASDAIIDEFDAVAPDASEFGNPVFTRQRVRWGRAVLQARSLASGVRRRRLRQEREGASYLRRASPGISCVEVTEVLDALARVTGRFREVQAASVAPDVVIVGRPP